MRLHGRRNALGLRRPPRPSNTIEHPQIPEFRHFVISRCDPASDDGPAGQKTAIAGRGSKKVAQGASHLDASRAAPSPPA